MIPRRITLVICPVCGRMAFSNVELKPGHYHRGNKCEGKPQGVMYVRAAALGETE